MSYLHIQNIGKAYKRYHKKWHRMAEWLGMKPRHELRWVLRDISFDVQPGEAVGIIGINGAGKSTLLKIITGTTKATTGTVEAGGRISALLELGMGFHPEFTGRQNAYMSAQLHGLSASDVDDKIRGIEEFAEIGDYFDQPVRTYSSGMQVRVAFSVATAVRPDILIVDEALSVGDIFFQQKCFDLIRSFINNGTTLLFVSHSTGTVYSLCTRAILIEAGKILLDDKPKPVIDLYNAKLVQQTSNESGTLKIVGQVQSASQLNIIISENENDTINNPTEITAEDKEIPIELQQDMGTYGSYFTEGVRIESVKLLVDGKEVGSLVSESNLTIRIQIAFDKAYSDPHVGFQIRDNRGEAVFMTNTFCMHREIGAVISGNRLEVDFSFQAALSEGQYTVTAGVANEGVIEGQFKQSLVRVQNALSFSVLRNHDAILWGGVYNLNPECKIRWEANN